MNPDEPAMQTRCPYCLAKQWAPSVPAFSRGETACPWCNQYTYPMSHAEWVAEITRRRRELMPHD